MEQCVQFWIMALELATQKGPLPVRWSLWATTLENFGRSPPPEHGDWMWGLHWP